MIPDFIPTVRYAVRETKAFVAHSFAPEDERVVELIKGFVEKVGLVVVTGEAAAPGGITDKIKTRISDCEVFIVIYTRREEITPGVFQAPTWLLQETGFAISESKQLIILVEDGVTNIGGLQADNELIPFRRDDLAPALLKIQEALLEIVAFKISITPNGLQMTGEFMRPERMIERLKGMIARGPVTPEPRLKLAQLYRSLGQTVEAVKQLEATLQGFPNCAPAHRMLADIQRNDNHLDAAVASYERALDFEANNCANYCGFGKTLMMKARGSSGEERERLLIRAQRYLQRAIELGGNRRCHGVGNAQNDLDRVNEMRGDVRPGFVVRTNKRTKSRRR
jgi:hypothetical protein